VRAKSLPAAKGGWWCHSRALRAVKSAPTQRYARFLPWPAQGRWSASWTSPWWLAWTGCWGVTAWPMICPPSHGWWLSWNSAMYAINSPASCGKYPSHFKFSCSVTQKCDYCSALNNSTGAIKHLYHGKHASNFSLSNHSLCSMLTTARCTLNNVTVAIKPIACCFTKLPTCTRG
jgi:hypothetical protein